MVFRSIALSTLGIALTTNALAQAPILEVRSFSGGETYKVEDNTATTAPPVMDDQNKKLWEMLQSIQRLEQQLQVVTGKLEQQEYTTKLLQYELTNRYNDLDQRIAGSEPIAKVEPAAITAPLTPALPVSAPVTAVPTPVAVSPAIAVAAPVLPPVSQTQPATVTATPPVVNSSTTPAATPKSISENEAYQKAYEAYKVGGASKAIEPMQYFIDNYPDSEYFPNANYWQGEFYLQLSPVQVDKANAYFSKVFNKFPQHSKASAALFRSANIADLKQNKSLAKSLMMQVLQFYPTSAEAEQAKAYLAK